MPLNLLIKPCSSSCNMKCYYCFYNDECENRQIRNYGMMGEETLETLISRAFENTRVFVSFSFQGGEPTLCGVEFYKKVIQLQNKYNKRRIRVYNSIQTNGQLIDEKWAEFLSKNGFSVGLSLDGTKATHDKYRKDNGGKGTWDRTVAAAEMLRSHHVDVNILCVVTDAVAKEPGRVYNTLKKYKYLQFIPCYDGLIITNQPYSLPADSYRTFLNKIFDLYYKDYFTDHPVYIRTFDNYIGMLKGKAPEICGALGYCTCYGAVEADGSVYPCDFYMTDKYLLGNVKENTFEEMLCSDKAKSFVAESYVMPNGCDGCPYFRLCGGGCRRERGKYTDYVRFCKSYRGFFEKNYEKLAELAIKTAFPSV